VNIEHGYCLRANILLIFKQKPEIVSDAESLQNRLDEFTSQILNLWPPYHGLVAAWLSGSALVSISEVTLRRARLVLEWVTVCV